MTRLSTHLSADYDGALWLAKRDGEIIGKFAFAHQALDALNSKTCATIASLRDANKALTARIRIGEAASHIVAEFSALVPLSESLSANANGRSLIAWVTAALADRDRLSAELAEARKLLETLDGALDDQGNPSDITHPDDLLLHNGVSITFGECRRARSFLASKEASHAE